MTESGTEQSKAEPEITCSEVEKVKPAPEKSA